MWRKGSFKESVDSDQSLSEEENWDDGWTNTCVSLGGPKEKKEGMQILSQLELLRDAYRLDHASTSTTSHEEGQSGFCGEDEVEIPVFQDESHNTFCRRMEVKLNSFGEVLVDNEEDHLFKLGSAKNEGVDKWFVATREAETLAHTNDSIRCSSSFAVIPEARKSYTGPRSKSKSSFSFHFQSHDIDRSSNPDMPQVLALTEESESKRHKMKYSRDECQRVSQEEEIEDLDILNAQLEVTVPNNYTEHSMAVLFDSMWDKSGSVQGNSRTNLDIPESRGRWNSLKEKLNIHESREMTMVNQFQESLSAALVNGEAPHLALPKQSVGLFVKLQHIIQQEKEQDKWFIKIVQMEASAHERVGFMDVTVLSRCLEARMTVCSCSFVGGEEWCLRSSSPGMEKKVGGMTLRVIFSTRISTDVELEVGNLIRIHTPWKEVNVNGRNEIVILSAYFSQLSN